MMAWAELSDVRCYYELLGDGQPLLLISGWGNTCRAWERITPHLVQSFSLILMDNRGIGRSAPKRPAFTLADYVADIIELLDELQLDRVHVLGISLGGIIAQRLAVDHPARIDRLVLVSCAERFTPYLSHMAALLGRSARWLPREVFARTLELLGTGPEYLDEHQDELAERIRIRCAAPVAGAALVHQLRCLARSQIAPGDYHISAPTLVVSGEHDAIIPSCYGRQMVKRIPGSRFLLAPGAGHNPLDENPERVIREIIEFLGETSHVSPRTRAVPHSRELIFSS